MEMVLCPRHRGFRVFLLARHQHVVRRLHTLDVVHHVRSGRRVRSFLLVVLFRALRILRRLLRLRVLLVAGTYIISGDHVCVSQPPQLVCLFTSRATTFTADTADKSKQSICKKKSTCTPLVQPARLIYVAGSKRKGWGQMIGPHRVVWVPIVRRNEHVRSVPVTPHELAVGPVVAIRPNLGLLSRPPNRHVSPHDSLHRLVVVSAARCVRKGTFETNF